MKCLPQTAEEKNVPFPRLLETRLIVQNTELLWWFTCLQDNILFLALTDMWSHISCILKNVFSPGDCNLQAATVFDL